jgi:predicted nucleotidyltransferase
MSEIEVKKIIRNYAKTLKARDFPVSAMYLFGSYAKGNAHKWSDIDVAVVSNKLKRNYEKNRTIIRNICLDVDTRLEPHTFTEKEFMDNSNPMSYEIRKTGIKVV